LNGRICTRDKYPEEVEWRELTAAPTSDVPFTAGREFVGWAEKEFGSPALSANVLRLGSGSLSVLISTSSNSQGSRWPLTRPS
jgi:hypothetical protein